ncbi:MAG: hypothetical protein AAGE99_03065 [Chlamydiota bacterium]
MFDQTFSAVDIPRLITLIFLEGVLSLDNALAIALIVRGLPKTVRQKALFIGLVSSPVFRVCGILSISYWIRFFWFRIGGGIYLLYLSLSRFITTRRAEMRIPRRKKNFWITVFLVEMTDLIFAIDSILAGLAMVGVSSTRHPLPSKVWIVYLGGVAGLIISRFAAKFFTDLIDRFPRLELGAHLMIGWIGLKLILDVLPTGLLDWTKPLFWIGIACFFSFGWIGKR